MDIRRFAQQVCRNAIVKESHAVDINMVAASKTIGNKRKRRSTLDGKDNDYEHEAKRRNTSSCSSQPHIPKSDITSSSDELSPQLTFANLTQRTKNTRFTRNSPAHLANNTDDDSPIRGFDDIVDHNSDSWHTRGDVTPHSKDSCRRNLQTMSPESDSKCCMKSMSGLRPCPLPALSWANASEVWRVMCEKDEACSLKRSANMLENHAELQPRMRAILLDWLIEVCEVYKLHRETYYLAVDYLDRYLSNNKKIQKTHLQLIGITCLFVAAKVEEIYPPKIGEFAYVTDGACQEEDILQQELLLLKTLDWSISPVTVLGWLGVYMQLNVSSRTPASFVNSEVKKDTQSSQTTVNSVCAHKLNSKVFANEDCGVCCTSTSNNNNSKSPRSRNSCKRKLDSTSCSVSSESSDEKIARMDNNTSSSSSLSTDDCDLDDAFIYPQFSGMEFVQTAQLLDLCSLDLGIASFPYSVIAAGAISHTFTRDIATRVSGLDWSVIAPCAQWMLPFFESTSEASQHLYLLESNEQVKSKFGLGHICPNIVTDDSHILQTHTTSIEMFDKACLRRDNLLTTLVQSESSPAIPPQCPEGLLTPPLSSRKPLDVESEPEINN